MSRKRSHTARATTPRPRKPRAPSVPGTTHAPLPNVFARSDTLPAAGLHADTGASPALDLIAPGGGSLGDVLLELVGAEHATLRNSLAVWQREQDRLLNRAWRRPGGLARPAGL
ncbi:MAG: hypothetical protein OJF49_002850 [Ktedonobacterales bacterium]|jgi:hypothetical protein|nr:MAG: hypothetical protein OJF49_002850 [Ktedonobacterales bacterium]